MSKYLLDTNIISFKKSGNLIDDIDILISGIAMSNNLIFVTDITKHFERIKSLKIENWR